MTHTRIQVSLPRPRRLVGLVLVGAVALASLAWVAPAAAGAPCCSITAIDLKSGVVSAVDKATKRTFQFTVKDAVVLKGLKVGQATYADFKTLEVSVNPDGAVPCCDLVNLKAPATR